MKEGEAEYTRESRVVYPHKGGPGHASGPGADEGHQECKTVKENLHNSGGRTQQLAERRFEFGPTTSRVTRAVT